MNHAEDCFHLGAKALIFSEGKVLLLSAYSKKNSRFIGMSLADVFTKTNQ